MSPLITVESGPRNARTDPDTGIRFYTWQGVEYVSVTSVRNAAGIPRPLAAWQVNQVIARVQSEYPTLANMIATSTPDAIKSWLWKAVTRERDAAADLGKRVHAAAAEGKPLADVTPDVAPFVTQYLSWLESAGAVEVLSERQVWNLQVGYAGSFDLIARFPNGSLWMIDIKTGKGTYAEHALQLEAYARAEFIGEDDVQDQMATALLREVTGRAILHLRPDGWSFKAIPRSEKSWVAFRGLLAFARWTLDNPTIDTLVAGTKEGAAKP